MKRIACPLLLLLLAGCATAPRDPAARAAFRAENDPLEPLNRKIFSFNQVVDRLVIKPVAEAYVRTVPRAGRDGLFHLLRNLEEPVVFANDTLQGEFHRANVTAGRFVLNSIFGLAGLFDVAGRHGIERQTGDFGQTLHAWGFPEGPYLMLPIVGPSSPRDGIGRGVDIYLDPFRYPARRRNYPTGLSAARVAASGIDERARNLDALDEIQREAVDYYASFRSFYRQNRAAELRHGVPPPAPRTDTFYDDPGEAAPQERPSGR